MCGIAGLVDLESQREIDEAVLQRMARVIAHRGPDEEGFFREPGVGLASRRLSIVGLNDGTQPIYNEDRSVVVVFNGELFDYPEQRQALRSRGHVLATSSDTEILVHLWEDYGEGMFERLRGQFAFALFDRRRRQFVLARDRVGICPLHWAIKDGWLVFGSEVKSILASGHVPAAADVRGLDHIFTFFAVPAPRTSFAGVSAVVPGRYLKFDLAPGAAKTPTEHTYWDLDFPSAGEEDCRPAAELTDEFEATLSHAVELRLRADVPVVGYLSGGIDSAMILALAARHRGESPPSFTVRVPSPRFDETQHALQTANHVGARSTVVTCDDALLADYYPRLITAAEGAVVDTSSAALLRLSREVHEQGYKVVLTGEGSDEALAGYPWFKIEKLLRLADIGPLRPSVPLSRALRRIATPWMPFAEMRRLDAFVSGPVAQSGFYHLVALSRSRFYSEEMYARLAGHVAYEDLQLDTARMRRWHPLNRALYLGYKVMLPGLLLNHKGDRVAMANSVETRYPFLDDEVIALTSRVHPRYKLRGVRRDKHLLRLAAARHLPPDIANRPKAMFRAPLASTFLGGKAAYVGELLSPESLRRTGYFDVERVRRVYARYGNPEHAPRKRVFLELGLASVLATQLWHHLYLGGGLCGLPTWTADAAGSFKRPHILSESAPLTAHNGRPAVH